VSINPSGSFPQCGDRFGTTDMIGNVWEWVSDKVDGAPKIIGGSHVYNEKARCSFTSTGSINSGTNQVGFRCCR